MTELADYPNYAKIVVTFEPREDGGLRAYSDDVPGFVLSHANPQAVLQDVKPALEGILSDIYGAPVVVKQLSSLREHLSGAKVDASVYTPPPPCQEYVGLLAA
jgi:hypothetical protein